MNWFKFLEELPAGVAVLDENFKVVFINKRILDKTGLPTQELKDPIRTIHPEDFPFAVECFAKLRTREFDKIPYPILIRVVKKGGYQWNEISWKIVEDEGKIYYLLTFTDVTNRVELQKRLESLIDYVKLLNSILRHDIMNNLASIISFSEMIEEMPCEEVLKTGLVNKVKESAWRAVNLIKKTKELEGSMGEELKPYNLTEVIKEAAAGYDIEVNIDGNATVLANEGIYVVFDNLISNSIKHGKATKIFIKIKEGSSKILLEFLDNGNGVPTEIGDKIFEEGFSTSKSTGLGLYIVKKLLESYGGNIRLKDCKGATFVLEFPRI